MSTPQIFREVTELWPLSSIGVIPRLSVIYRIVHLPTGREYIGSAVDFLKRASCHRVMLRAGKHHSKYLQNAFTKHSESEFAFGIVEIVSELGELVRREQIHILARRPEFNSKQVSSSTLGFIYSEESKRRMSDAAKKRANTPEFKARISALFKGKKRDRSVVERSASKLRGRKGWKPNEAQKQNLSAKAKGRIVSSKTAAKISAHHMGRKLSEAHKAAISKGHQKRKLWAHSH